jgi:ribosomal protein S18 acetylase RimI-like enzyme
MTPSGSHFERKMIRPALESETPALVTIAEETGVFKLMEIKALEEVLTEYHAANLALGHRCVSYEANGELLGFAYYAPTAMTDRGWHLYWIAVSKRTQARGIGGALLHHVEEDIQQVHGRQLLIETSSLPHYDLTRKFYLKQGYEEACIQPDYYADGDHMVVYRKRFRHN